MRWPWEQRRRHNGLTCLEVEHLKSKLLARLATASVVSEKQTEAISEAKMRESALQVKLMEASDLPKQP